MKNILVVSGHTDLNNSVANKTILQELQKDLPNAEFVFLDKLYPTFQIDRELEQQRLLKADIIVLQFPLFWYGVPSIMSRWIEEVFVHGFSHGSTGDKVSGKKLVVSFTSGAPEETYKRGGLQNYDIEEFLPLLKQFANLCRMDWCGYVYTGGVSYINRNDEVKVKQIQDKAIKHEKRLLLNINEILVNK